MVFVLCFRFCSSANINGKEDTLWDPQRKKGLVFTQHISGPYCMYTTQTICKHPWISSTDNTSVLGVKPQRHREITGGGWREKDGWADGERVINHWFNQARELTPFCVASQSCAPLPARRKQQTPASEPHLFKWSSKMTGGGDELNKQRDFCSSFHSNHTPPPPALRTS